MRLDWLGRRGRGRVGGGAGLVTIAVHRGVVCGGRSRTIAVLVNLGGGGVVCWGGTVAIHGGRRGVMGGGGRGVRAGVGSCVMGVGGAPIHGGRHVHRGRVRGAALCAPSNNKQSHLKLRHTCYSS